MNRATKIHYWFCRIWKSTVLYVTLAEPVPIVTIAEHDADDITMTTVTDAAKLFVRYNFRAILIIDDEGVMIGAIPFRDVMELRQRS